MSRSDCFELWPRAARGAYEAGGDPTGARGRLFAVQNVRPLERSLAAAGWTEHVGAHRCGGERGSCNRKHCVNCTRCPQGRGMRDAAGVAHAPPNRCERFWRRILVGSEIGPRSPSGFRREAYCLSFHRLQGAFAGPCDSVCRSAPGDLLRAVRRFFRYVHAGMSLAAFFSQGYSPRRCAPSAGRSALKPNGSSLDLISDRCRPSPAGVSRGRPRGRRAGASPVPWSLVPQGQAGLGSRPKTASPFQGPRLHACVRRQRADASA